MKKARNLFRSRMEDRSFSLCHQPTRGQHRIAPAIAHGYMISRFITSLGPISSYSVAVNNDIKVISPYQ